MGNFIDNFKKLKFKEIKLHSSFCKANIIYRIDDKKNFLIEICLNYDNYILITVESFDELNFTSRYVYIEEYTLENKKKIVFNYKYAFSEYEYYYEINERNDDIGKNFRFLFTLCLINHIIQNTKDFSLKEKMVIKLGEYKESNEYKKLNDFLKSKRDCVIIV